MSQSRYELLERLGSGGMAKVFRARDTVLDRIVAVKVLHDDLAEEPDVAARFIREARIAAQLQHANIVQVFDLDEERVKALNDRYGHLVGDEVLSAFAYLARQELRATDVIDLDSEGRCFGRFGGEEFMCLLPSTSEAGVIG